MANSHELAYPEGVTAPPRLPRALMVALVVLPLAWLTVVLGYVQVMSSGEVLIFSAACWIVCLACLAETSRQIWAGTINLGLLLSAQTALWYALPWTYLPTVDLRTLHFTVQSVQNLAVYTVIILMMCLFTAAVSSCLPLRMRVTSDVSRESERAILWLVLAMCAIQVPLIATGYWGYANVTGGVRGVEAMPAYLSALETVTVAVPPMVSLLFAAVLRRNDRGRTTKVLLLLLLVGISLVQLFWFSTQSRRTMATVLFVSTLLFYRARYPLGLKPSNYPWIFLSVGLLCAGLLAMWSFYYSMRIATFMAAGTRNFSLFDLPEILALASRIDSDYSQNLVARPFMLLQSVETVASEARGVLLGWNLTSQVLLALPPVLFQDKLAFIGPVLESLWTVALDIPPDDWSNTLLLEAYVDFGYVGFPIYVLFIAASMKLLDIPTRVLGGERASLVYGLVVLVSMLNVETSIVTYLVAIRSVLVVTLFLFLVRALSFAFRRSSPA